MRRLPPFPELIAFEAVARHLSFTRAAAELCITQSAVSHRVKRLERHFGTQLIRRLNPGLALTDAGVALLPELNAVLNGLEALGGRDRKLRVAAGSALCAWWLAKRLPDFMTQRPGLSIELVPIDNEATTIPYVDVRILWVGAGDDAPSATQTPLFSEQVFPVCSPRLLPNRRPLADRDGLRTLKLLHKASRTRGEWNWQNWFDHLSIECSKSCAAELRFTDMGLLLSAAVEGAGVAIVRSLLVHDALWDGRLVLPIVDFEPMLSVKKHVARWRRDKVDDPDIQSFVTWLVAEAKATMEGTASLLNEARSSAPAPRRTALHSVR